MDKVAALDFLDRLQAKGTKLGLGRVRRFLRLFGNPQEKFDSILVAGTNGKGSTAAMIESILRRAGYKTGLYTSPFLVSFNEKIKVGGKKISDREFLSLFNRVRTAMEKSKISVSYFEFVTAMAFLHFAKKKVELAVLEVGMGGRLDATNVVKPMVSVITNVERDHEEHLGKTLERIAFEKAGIINQGVPVATAEWKPRVLKVFREKCRQKNAALRMASKPYSGTLSLQGDFQKWNAALAAVAADVLRKQGLEISDKALSKGLAGAEWPGRFQSVHSKPAVVVDCAHNPASCLVLSRAFKKKFPGKKCTLVIGISSGKRFRGMAKRLAPIAKRVVATSARYRAMPPEKIAAEFEVHGVKAKTVPGVSRALEETLSSAKESGVVLVAGSCFVAGEALEFFIQRH